MPEVMEVLVQKSVVEPLLLENLVRGSDGLMGMELFKI